MELLSPAGGYEALVAAVQSGADAVYMGFGAFNARRGARNFTDEEFASAVQYCHLRGVRVFLTLNTLVTDRELPAAAEALRRASAQAVSSMSMSVLCTSGSRLSSIRPGRPMPAPRSHTRSPRRTWAKPPSRNVSVEGLKAPSPKQKRYPPVYSWSQRSMAVPPLRISDRIVI